MDVRHREVAQKIISCATIATLLFSLVSPAFAAVAPSFIALQTVANSSPANTQTATTVVTQPATNEVKASRTIIVNSIPATNETITIGSCTVTFTNGNSDLDCSTGTTHLKNNGAQTTSTIAANLRSLTLSDPIHLALDKSGSGSTATFTTSGSEVSNTPIVFTDNTGGDITSTSSTTGVVALPKMSTVTIANVEVGDTFSVDFGGGFTASFTAVTVSASDVADGLNNQIIGHGMYSASAFTTSVTGNTITFTGKVAGNDFTQTSSTTNASPVAQVVTFTPADPVGGLEYQMTINGNTTAASTTSLTTVADITAAIVGLFIDSDVSCVDNTTHITCTANVAGTAFTYATAIDDTEAPVITLLGNTPVTVEAGSVYTDDGATASDNVDGDITANIVTGGTFTDTNTVGSFTVTYNVSDAASNSATEVTRTIDVTDTVAPTMPTIVSPLNNSSYTTVAMDKVDWTDSTDVSAVTYIYSVSSSGATNPNGTFVTPLYTSGTLTASEIPTPGTPEGVYYFSVKAVDASSNESPWTAPTKVTIDNTAPIITVDPYTTTPTNTDVTVTVSTNEGTLNTNTYTFTANGSFTFTATDDAGNVTNETITLTNIDKTAPVITLNGSTPMDVSYGATYVEPGASCTDNVDPVCSVVINGSVVTSALGTYFVTYDATDSVGNAAPQSTRTVNVVDVEIPIITLLGTATITVAQNSVYTDAGATASDNVDGDITANIVTGGSVDTAILGDYVLTFDVTDSSLNTATQVTRTVTVADLTAPTLTEITPVSTPTNDNTPSYTFSSDEAGNITYGGGCTSATTVANIGNNTIDLDLLPDATYATCTITVTDSATIPNTSTPLTLSTFTIDTTDPAVTINQAGTQDDPTASSILYFTAVLSETIVDTTFTCDDVVVTNAVCDSVTNSGVNTFTIQIHSLAEGISTASIAGSGIEDLAGNTNTVSTSTDNSVHFTASGGGGGGGGISIIVPEVTNGNNDQNSQTNPETTPDTTNTGEETEEDTLISDDEVVDTDETTASDDEENDDFITPPSPETNTGTDPDETPAQSTSYPNNALPTRPNTPYRPTSNTGSSNTDTSAASETSTDTSTEETTQEPVQVVSTEIVPETPVDIGGGTTPEPSSSLPWILLALIAVLNFAWFYTRKDNSIPPSNNPPA